MANNKRQFPDFSREVKESRSFWPANKNGEPCWPASNLDNLAITQWKKPGMTFDKAKAAADDLLAAGKSDGHICYAPQRSHLHLIFDVDTDKIDGENAEFVKLYHTEILDASTDTYVERSKSGKSYHIIYALPSGHGLDDKRQNSTLQLDLFVGNGYVTLTGDRVCDKPIARLKPADVKRFHRIFPKNKIELNPNVPVGTSDPLTEQQAIDLIGGLGDRYKFYTEGPDAIAQPKGLTTDMSKARFDYIQALTVRFFRHENRDEMIRSILRQSWFACRHTPAYSSKNGDRFTHPGKLARVLDYELPTVLMVVASEQEADREMVEHGGKIRVAIMESFRVKKEATKTAVDEEAKEAATDLSQMAFKAPAPTGTPVDLPPPGLPGSFRHEFHKHCQKSAQFDVDVIHQARTEIASSVLFGPDLLTPTNDSLNLYAGLITRAGVGKDSFRQGPAFLGREVIDRLKSAEESNLYILGLEKRFGSSRIASAEAGEALVEGKKGVYLYWPERLKSLTVNRPDKVSVGIEGFLLDGFNRGQKNWSGEEKWKAAGNEGGGQSCSITAGWEGTIGDFKNLNLMAGTDGAFARTLPFYFEGAKPLPKHPSLRSDDIADELIDAAVERFRRLKSVNGPGDRLQIKYGASSMDYIHDLQSSMVIAENREILPGLQTMYSRAAQIILRMASRYAFDDNPMVPTLERSHIDEAYHRYTSLLAPVLSLARSGDTGLGSGRQRSEVVRAIAEYFSPDGKLRKQDLKHRDNDCFVPSGLAAFLQSSTCTELKLTDAAQVMFILEGLVIEGHLVNITPPSGPGRKPSGIFKPTNSFKGLVA